MSQESRDSSSVRTRSDSRDRSSSDMPVLSRSNSRSDSKDRSGNPTSESKDKVKAEPLTFKLKDVQSTSARSESRDVSKTTKQESSKLKTESKHKVDSGDKKIKYTDPPPEKEKKPKIAPETTPPESENKGPPIKIKLSLSQIKAFTPTAQENSDSETSFEDYIEPKRQKKKDGSSGKKKK